MDANKSVFMLLVVLAQIVGVLSVILMAVWMGKYQGGFAWTKELKFNYHPLFMTIGMVFIYGDAILVYRVFRNDRKIFIKVLHMVMQLSAFGFAVFGLEAVFSAHRDENNPNLYSVHDWLGIATVSLFGMQFLLGFLFYLFPQVSESLKSRYMSLHRYWGVTIFCMAVAAALLGTLENVGFKVKDYSSRTAEAYVINFMAVCFIVFGWLVTYIVHKPEYKRDPSPGDYSSQLQDD